MTLTATTTTNSRIFIILSALLLLLLLLSASSLLSSSSSPFIFIFNGNDDQNSALAIPNQLRNNATPSPPTITTPPPNHSPISNAGVNQTVNEGYAVTLDGTASKDPDGDPLSYSWTQTGGGQPSVKLADADTSIATFTAPSNITADTDLVFTLTVKDSKNASSTDTVKVTVKYIQPPNQPPVANAGTDQTVNAGDTVRLDGSKSSDPDGKVVSYSWKQIGGPSVSTINGADTATPSFTAPSVSADTTLKFSLTVTDDKGSAGSRPATVTISVKAATPPTTKATNATETTTKPPSSTAKEYSFLKKWGSKGNGNGQFDSPESVAVDSKTGNMYVVDTGNNRIQKFDSNGNFIKKWGSEGSGDGQFAQPSGIAVDSKTGNMYIGDYNNERIQKFDSNGNFIKKWDSTLAGGGIAVDSKTGNVYVSDGNRIQKWDSNDALITEWGSQGTGDGQFYLADSIAVDSDGNLYVADFTINRVQKFDSNGKFMIKWGSKGNDEPNISPCNGSLLYCSTRGNGDGEFDSPSGIAIDSFGNVYVAEWGNNPIQKFDSNGNFITKWGSHGSGDGQFDSPSGIAIDSKTGNVYVVDTDNNRIQLFAPSNNTSK